MTLQTWSRTYSSLTKPQNKDKLLSPSLLAHPLRYAQLIID